MLPGRAELRSLPTLYSNTVEHAAMRSIHLGSLALAVAAMLFAADPAGAQTRIISGLIPYCASAAGGNNNAGTPLVTWFCSSAADEVFTFASGGEIRLLDKCVEASGGKGNDGDKVVLSGCNGQANQRWRVSRNQIIGVTGKCVDIKNASVLPWGELILYRCDGASNQKWGALQATGRRSGAFKLENIASLSALSRAAAQGATYKMSIASDNGGFVVSVSPLGSITPR
jgi:ricin-type beta-trefoil lectin protein